MSLGDLQSGRQLDHAVTDGAPKPIGAYSQAVTCGGFVFTSGQIAIDPGSGELVKTGIEQETEQVLRNLSSVLAAAGTGLDRAVRVNVYLTDMALFARVNAVYGRYFSEPFPARTTVQVSALPKGASVEIDVIAAL
ncbi:MAG: RidA family protein [candidate division WOR-3 bacterium]